MTELPFRRRRRGTHHGMNGVVRGKCRACQYDFVAVFQASFTEHT